MSIGRRPLGNLGSLMISVFSEAVKEKSSKSPHEREKIAGEYGKQISFDKSKIFVNSIEPRSSTDKWMPGKMLEEVD